MTQVLVIVTAAWIGISLSVGVLVGRALSARPAHVPQLQAAQARLAS